MHLAALLKYSEFIYINTVSTIYPVQSMKYTFFIKTKTNNINRVYRMIYMRVCEYFNKS